ncbi:hypothetical protein PPN31114_00198 [Pandoraea pneumonica]|uniref:Anti-bacteriophage protein A/HamA C-terminal domain-containing protein n=1 Tax=Pandoraea pneumonica TaxID=2508299 RepID=A0A5E4RM51_9BURK|nr:DUF1837 domain-containing protein [Pandoraea pneumonica]VVD62948.1 hypothetical protein PPN31114_00198 [Pandoraea pneumonica]
MTGAFFNVVVDDIDRKPALTGICAGYEQGSWRVQQLATVLFRSLPDFCLRHSECRDISVDNAMQLISSAAKTMYQTEKFKSRGEFGELILHVVLKQLFNTLPAISKIFFKDSVNNTVKGFDAIHVVPTATGLQLWLGEVKFYTDISKAVDDVCKELDVHFSREYLRNEFLLINRKIDDTWPHAERLRALTAETTSLDTVFETVCVPVLLTYESSTTAKHAALSEQYKAEMLIELEKHYSRFVSKNRLTTVTIRLILFPLRAKALLVDELHRKLGAAQCL